MKQLQTESNRPGDSRNAAFEAGEGRGGKSVLGEEPREFGLQCRNRSTVSEPKRANVQFSVSGGRGTNWFRL